MDRREALDILGDAGDHITHATCGDVAHYATTPDDDGTTMTIAWGQNTANNIWRYMDFGD
ncbi:hypothetical protein VKT23_013623 [Stygiomarasmius scandens]|uniref:Uncharacterized protein n=1 Tax=Marasmiellus scandens TaxID=2682957 RepID=A0ABR1J6A8_9AGAR